MSHVTEISDVSIVDLDCLERACKAIGLQLNRDKKTYKWFGRHVGDYPLPKGFTKEDMGKCEHSISIPGNRNSYEIGVVSRRDGKDGYTLHFDFWNGGYGMEAVAGKNATNIVDQYCAEAAMQAALMQGLIPVSKETCDGKIEMIFQS